jgi:hypothetical protein
MQSPHRSNRPSFDGYAANDALIDSAGNAEASVSPLVHGFRTIQHEDTRSRSNIRVTVLREKPVNTAISATVYAAFSITDRQLVTSSP